MKLHTAKSSTKEEDVRKHSAAEFSPTLVRDGTGYVGVLRSKISKIKHTDYTAEVSAAVEASQN